ncbi:MAG: nitroreductase family protein [Actinomycetota bacterium]|nr:nitroreductase family protein [Actinomycetota bacterium]
MALLALTPDELLSTTRAVRKRLDFERPVERELLDECLALAQQAPNASNSEPWRFVVVTEEATRAKLAECYRTGWSAYRKQIDEQARDGTDPPVLASAQYLADRFHEVPAMVLPCLVPRADSAPSARQAGLYGSVIQAAWSFQLAARARGLGTCWTTLHLPRERDAAELLGIPYERVQQVALITVGYTLGTDFKPGRRVALERVVRYERWR